MNALKSLRSKINKTTRTYPLKKIYEVQSAAGRWDDSRIKSEVDSCSLVCLTSISLQIIKDQIYFGICLPPDTDIEELHWGTHFPRTKSYSMGIRAESRNVVPMITWSSFTPVNELAWKWLPTCYIPELLATRPALPGSSASPLILETLSDPCTSHYYRFFLSLLTLVSVTCKQNTLTVKAATQICAAREGEQRRGNQ